MPSKDPEKRRAVHKRWSERNIRAGYGKWLYAKRKAHRADAYDFQRALEHILDEETVSLEAARMIASKAISDSRKRHKDLRTWREQLTLLTLAEKEASE